MRLGVHLSIKNGFEGALIKAQAMGCDGFQIFAGNPRGWARKPIDPTDIAAFKKSRLETKLWPIVVHLSYLPNPAAADNELYQKSVQTLAEDFQRANLLGADFFVFHPGKGKGAETNQAVKRVATAVNLVLDQIKGNTVLLFENQSGAGSEIASTFEDLASLIEKVKYPDRVGICFDTCHAFAAGYDLSHPLGWDNTLADLQKYLGLNYLKLFHLNDSTGKIGSHLDRHQHIGKGFIGLKGFHYLMNHLELTTIPGILETPQETPGDDLQNLSVLRNLVGKEVLI